MGGAIATLPVLPPLRPTNVPPSNSREFAFRVMSKGYSDGNAAGFVVSGKTMTSEPGTGMNILVLKEDRTFHSFRTFCTYSAVAFTAGTCMETQGSREMVQYLEALPDGSIVMVAAMDEAQSGLCQKARDALKEIGAQQIDKISARASYALISIKGGERLSEVLTDEGCGGAVAEADLPKPPEPEPEVKQLTPPEPARRRGDCILRLFGLRSRQTRR